MVSLSKLFAASAAVAVTSASSAEFILNSNCHTGTYPLTIYAPLYYNEDGIVGTFRDCDTCYNFSGKITDEGYYEITESSEGDLKNSKYLNIDEDSGIVTINDTAETAPFLISTHLVYFNESLDYYLIEQEYNKTYFLYFVDDYNTSSTAKNYSTTLNSAFSNGTRYLYYEPDETTSTQSISKIDHIPNSTGASSSSATSSSESTSTSDSSETTSTTKSSGASKETFGLGHLIASVIGWAYVYLG